MNGTNGNNGKNGIRVWIPVIVAIIGTFGAGAGANYLLISRSGTLQEIARPDPFTGSEAAALTARVTSLEYHVKNHPDMTNRFDARITRLEAQYTIILANQQRILDRLDKR